MSDYKSSKLISITFVVTVVFVVVFGSVNVYTVEDSDTTIYAKVVGYESSEDSMDISVILSNKFKPHKIKIIAVDTVIHDIGKRFGQSWTAKITRTFTYDHLDKLFHDSKPSGNSFTILFTIGDLEIGNQIYEHKCKDFMCSELFNGIHNTPLPLKFTKSLTIQGITNEN